MAAVGVAEVTGSWFLSGAVSFFIVVLLLSIFLTALCSDCRRRSFELQDSGVSRYPSSLIRVVKLEDAMGGRENPTINDIKNDEKESVTVWRSHLGAPQDQRVIQTNGSAAVTKASSGPEPAAEEDSVQIPPWRSHLGAPQSRDPDRIYHVIGGGRSSNGDANVSSPPTNQEPGQGRGNGVVLSDHERNSLYARVSKKAKLTTPPVDTPEQVQVEVRVEEEEEASPPLPDRSSQLDG